MDTKDHRINLTQKRKARDGPWQFYPVQRDGNKPGPRLILIDGEPASWKGRGAYYLDWREDGKRRRKQVGKSPREALDAWRVRHGQLFRHERLGATRTTAEYERHIESTFT